MRVEVLLFGAQAQAVGSDRIAAALPSARPTCADLRHALHQAAPALRPQLPTLRFAVNHEFVADDHRLNADDEVALIGMVSGG
jgi:molybdopterin converting factor small subunit